MGSCRLQMKTSTSRNSSCRTSSVHCEVCVIDSRFLRTSVMSVNVSKVTLSEAFFSEDMSNFILVSILANEH